MFLTMLSQYLFLLVIFCKIKFCTVVNGSDLHTVFRLDWCVFSENGSAKHDNTMVTIRQYGGESSTVRWCQYDSARVSIRQYDGVNTTVRWWQYDDTMDKHDSTMVTVNRTVVLSPWYCRTVMFRAFRSQNKCSGPDETQHLH
jgi:hypothetical protein